MHTLSAGCAAQGIKHFIFSLHEIKQVNFVFLPINEYWNQVQMFNLCRVSNILTITPYSMPLFLHYTIPYIQQSHENHHFICKLQVAK